jgi:hypothetical protein
MELATCIIPKGKMNTASRVSIESKYINNMKDLLQKVDFSNIGIVEAKKKMILMNLIIY